MLQPPPSNIHTYRKPSIKPPKGERGLSFSMTSEGGLYNLAKRVTCSKNTGVSDRVDLCVVTNYGTI